MVLTPAHRSLVLLSQRVSAARHLPALCTDPAAAAPDPAGTARLQHSDTPGAAGSSLPGAPRPDLGPGARPRRRAAPRPSAPPARRPPRSHVGVPLEGVADVFHHPLYQHRHLLRRLGHLPQPAVPCRAAPCRAAPRQAGRALPGQRAAGAAGMALPERSGAAEAVRPRAGWACGNSAASCGRGGPGPASGGSRRGTRGRFLSRPADGARGRRWPWVRGCRPESQTQLCAGVSCRWLCLSSFPRNSGCSVL